MAAARHKDHAPHPHKAAAAAAATSTSTDVMTTLPAHSLFALANKMNAAAAAAQKKKTTHKNSSGPLPVEADVVRPVVQEEERETKRTKPLKQQQQQHDVQFTFIRQ